MKKFTNNEKMELIEYITDVAKKYGAETMVVDDDDLKDFVLTIIGQPKYRIALDPQFFDFGYSMTLPETSVLEEQKAEIEKAIFELTAYGYLFCCLLEKGAEYTINKDENGYVVNCEVSSTEDAVYEFFLEFCPCMENVSIEDNEDFITYTLSSGSMERMENIIKSTINDLVDAGSIYICN